MRVDGSVITWGISSQGGDSSAVATQLDGTVDVTQIYATGRAFAALRTDRKIVIADDSEAEQRYTSDYRGRVQDKNVNITLEPMFALTYYEKMSDVKRSVNFHKYIEDLNRTGILPKRLRITNMEAPLTEEQVKVHFALIDTHTSAIVEDDKNASKRFARAIDFYLVQDFSSAVSDLTAIS